MAVRIQISLYGRLVAEAVVESLAEADKLWSKYAIAKYNKGMSIGGAAISNYNSSRFWNVPVGGKIES